MKKYQFGGWFTKLLKSYVDSPAPSLYEDRYKKVPPRGSWTKMEPLEPDRPINNNTYGPYNLPGVQVNAVNLAKPQPFPYGEINVESNNGKTLAYPTGNSPLQEAVFKNKAKRQVARGSLFKNGGKPKLLKALFGMKSPLLNEWKFRRTTNNLNNGYSVTSDQIMLTKINGQSTYDTPPIVSGRTIYSTPKGNDTIFYSNNPYIFEKTPQGDKNQNTAKSYFYNMIKKAPIEGELYRGTKYWNNDHIQMDAARNRALKGYQSGGEIKPDNTRVQRIPNNGESVYESTPQGIGDFLPVIGTMRAALRIDKGEPNASYGDLVVNAGMDLLGAGMIGSVAKAATKAGRIHKALKASGYKLVGPEPTKFVKTANLVKTVKGYMDPTKTYTIDLGPKVIASKKVPSVDYYNIAMLPMIQSLRVPATAPFK